MLFLIFCHLLLKLWMFILNMGKVNNNNNEVCKPNLQIAVNALIFSTLCSVWCQRIFLKWNSQSGEGEGGLKGKGASSLFQTEDELRSTHRAVLSLVGSKNKITEVWIFYFLFWPLIEYKLSDCTLEKGERFEKLFHINLAAALETEAWHLQIVTDRLACFS